MKKLLCAGILALAVTAILAGCGSSNSSAGGAVSNQANVFVSGTDAPLPSVLSFTLDVTSFSLTDSSGNQVQLLNGTSTVDFARYDGLHTFLDMNTIPPGTYSAVNVTIANPGIVYLNTGVTPPAPGSISASLTTGNLSFTLPSPLTVTAGETVGMGFDFEIAQSLETDSNGQITGVVNPQFTINVLTPSDADYYIDEFVGSVVSVNTGNDSFVIQGPHGRQYTVDLNSGTEFENGESISDLTTSSIVEISGQFAGNSQTFTADTIGILSQNGYVADGLVTYVNLASGAASNFNLYVRGSLPAGEGLTLGEIANVELNGSEKFGIYAWHTPLSQFVFNSSSLLPGQRVSIGGPVADASNEQDVVTKRVMLKHEGHDGAWIAGSTNLNAGAFQFDPDGLAGVLFNSASVTIYTSAKTQFEGLSGLSALSGNANIAIRVVGLVVKDPTTGAPIILARRVVALQ